MFSDRHNGRAAALRAARAFRGRLICKLPPPTRIHRKHVRNTTGIVGVSLVKERTRSGKLMVRYVAQWPKSGKRAKATFSVGYYGKAEAFSLAVNARQKGLRELYAEARRLTTLK